MPTLESLSEEHAAWWIDLLGEHNHVGGMESTRWLALRARLEPGTRVLDCGAFVGSAARYLATEFGARPIATDLAADFLATGRGMAGGDRVDWVVASTDRLPFADGSQQSVWALDTMLVPAELSRVAAARATLCICTQLSLDSRHGVNGVAAEYTPFGWSLFAHRLMNSDATQLWRKAEAEFVRRRTHFQPRYGQREYLSQLDMLNTMLRSYEIGEMGHGLFVFTRG